MRVLWADRRFEYLAWHLDYLKKCFPDVEFRTVSTFGAAEILLENLKIDVLIIEVAIPSNEKPEWVNPSSIVENGLILLRRIKKGNFEPLNRNDLPVVVYTTSVALLFRGIPDEEKEINLKELLDLLLDPKRDLICPKISTSLKDLANTVRKALELAKMQPGEVKTL